MTAWILVGVLGIAFLLGLWLIARAAHRARTSSDFERRESRRVALFDAALRELRDLHDYVPEHWEQWKERRS